MISRASLTRASFYGIGAGLLLNIPITFTEGYYKSKESEIPKIIEYTKDVKNGILGLSSLYLLGTVMKDNIDEHKKVFKSLEKNFT